MLKVDFSESTDDSDQMRPCGSIVWDGNQFMITPDNDAMRSILQEPIWVPENDSLVDVFAKDEPERFMRCLCQKYRSAYFSASNAVSI